MAKIYLLAVAMGCIVVLGNAAFAHGDQTKGEKLYENYCAGCHGIDGDGMGAMGQTLNPPPANLLEAMQTKIISDEYLMWTIKEGGRNIHTGMPSFEEQGKINEADTKAIIRYLWRAFK